VVVDVCTELRRRLDVVLAAGVDPERVVLDPGLGFAKTAEHNWALLHSLDRLRELGRPVLVAASRKAFLGRLPAAVGQSRGPCDRDDATAATSALAAAAGAWCVRVHAVRASRDAVEVAARWAAG
jgi:dihydropteroate synthase